MDKVKAVVHEASIYIAIACFGLIFGMFLAVIYHAVTKGF